MRRHEHSRVVHLVCQGKELLGERMGRLVLGPHKIKIPQSPQHRKQLPRVFEVLTEVPCTGIGLFHLLMYGRLSLEAASAMGRLRIEGEQASVTAFGQRFKGA